MPPLLIFLLHHHHRRRCRRLNVDVRSMGGCVSYSGARTWCRDDCTSHKADPCHTEPWIANTGHTWLFPGTVSLWIARPIFDFLKFTRSGKKKYLCQIYYFNGSNRRKKGDEKDLSPGVLSVAKELTKIKSFDPTSLFRPQVFFRPQVSPPCPFLSLWRPADCSRRLEHTFVALGTFFLL